MNQNDESMACDDSMNYKIHVPLNDYYLCLHPKPEQYRRDSPKIGRNQLCVCGSGKEFKKCCMLRGDK